MKGLFMATALIAVTVATAAAQADPYTGVWTRRPAGEGSTQVLTIKVANNAEDYTSDMTAANGRRQLTHYAAKYDGKEYPSQTVVTESGKSTTRDDTVILKKVDERTRERHWKQGGRVVRILRRSVSADGKVLTSVVVDIDEQGREKVASTLVFDKK
jgi:hypothetical protein